VQFTDEFRYWVYEAANANNLIVEFVFCGLTVGDYSCDSAGEFAEMLPVTSGRRGAGGSWLNI
jgi:hypothetical protein